MNLPIAPTAKLIASASATASISKSNSVSSLSALPPEQVLLQTNKRLWRAIDFLHITVMCFALYTSIIVAILRNELNEQCPLYAKLYLRDNETQLAPETIEKKTVWGGVYTCEFVSFAYLSVFILSFISLWIHIVFRRVFRTERLLRLPIGLITLAFAVTSLVATFTVTDGVVKFCLNSEENICSSSGDPVFRKSRWKLVTLPAGGWLTSLSILLNVFVRGVQLFAKPKKSPETLKILLNQLMMHRHQLKNERESSEYGSQITRSSAGKTRRESINQYSMNQPYNLDFPPELSPYYYPPVPQYRQIEKPSWFQRICCSCFCCRRRRRNRHNRRSQESFQQPYRPFVIPEEYFHRLNYLRQNGTVPINECPHHSTHHHVERQTQTDSIPQRKSIDEASETPFLGRRRSSVRFEDEIPLVKIPEEQAVSPKTDITPTTNKKDDEARVPTSDNQIERNVSFRNNEDDLWTTITITGEKTAPIQSGHFNRLSLENLSIIDTSASNNDNPITSIHINSKCIELSTSHELVDSDITPPLKPSTKMKQNRLSTNRRKSIPPAPPLLLSPSSSRTYTPSSEDDTDLRHIKPSEEIHAIVTDKYNYNNLSQALKSNVERLKTTFNQSHENQTHCQASKNVRIKPSQKLRQYSNIQDQSSFC